MRKSCNQFIASREQHPALKPACPTNVQENLNCFLSVVKGRDSVVKCGVARIPRNGFLIVNHANRDTATAEAANSVATRNASFGAMGLILGPNPIRKGTSPMGPVSNIRLPAPKSRAGQPPGTQSTSVCSGSSRVSSLFCGVSTRLLVAYAIIRSLA